MPEDMDVPGSRCTRVAVSLSNRGASELDAFIAGSGIILKKAKSLVVCVRKRLLKRVVAWEPGDFAAFRFFGSGSLLPVSFLRKLLPTDRLPRVDF